MIVWRPADPENLPAARGFLARREWSCCSLSSRLLRSGSLEFPPPKGMRLFAWLPEEPRSAIPRSAGGLFLSAPSGNLYPALADSPPGEDRELAALAEIDRRKTSVCVGLETDVARMEKALELESAAGDYYYLMVLESCPPGNGIEPPFDGLSSFAPGMEDLDALFPLQAAYEKEEVLVPIHRPDPRATRSGLAAALGAQKMLCASYRGRIIAKAQTNARGMGWDQLGGVYVEPEFRGRGVGTWLVAGLCFGLLGSGRKLTLFVKKKNAAAITSYRKIGFRFRDSYRISYYS